MRFKVGDKVRIKDNLESISKTARTSFTLPMEKYEGLITQVTFVSNVLEGYNLKDCDYIWTENMLEAVEKGGRKMKLKDLIEKYGEYEIQEDKIDELLIKPKSKTIWDLEEGEVYFYFNNSGQILANNWTNYDGEQKQRNYGSIFLTRKEAEKELARRKIETELLRFGGKKEFEVGNFNYYLYVQWDCNSLSYKLDIDYSETDIYPNTVYFDSEEDIKDAISQIGKYRLLKEYFGIEEEM